TLLWLSFGVTAQQGFFAQKVVGQGRASPSGNLQLVVQLGHSSDITSAAFSPNKEFMVSGGVDRIAIVWEVATGRVLRRLVGHTAPVNTVAFSPDGKLILTGSGADPDSDNAPANPDNTARLWDATTGQPLRNFVGHLGPVESVQFSPDGQIVLTGSADGT